MQTISYLLNVVSECFLEVQYKGEKDRAFARLFNLLLKLWHCSIYKITPDGKPQSLDKERNDKIGILQVINGKTLFQSSVLRQTT